AESGGLACDEAGGERARLDIHSINLLEGREGLDVGFAEHALDHPGDRGERQAAREERLDGHLVRGIERGGRGAAEPDRLLGEREAGKTRGIGALELELAEAREVERPDAGGDALGPRERAG